MVTGPDDRSPLVELVAASLDASEELLPHLPELLRDLEDLGARAVDVVAVLQGHGFARGSRILDLGCGKGASAIALARAFGATVRGVDGMPAFIEHATAQAGAQGVADLCDFQIGDVRDIAPFSTDYDLVMLLALGPMFGQTDETVGVLRRCVRPGGLILLDEAYVADGEQRPAHAEACLDRRATIELLESHGDRVVAERSIDTEDNERWCRNMTRRIVARARDIATRDQALAEALVDFAERQRIETEVLAGPLVGALWLIEVSREPAGPASR